MKIDTSSLLIGLLGGASGAVAAPHVAGFLAQSVSWPSLLCAGVLGTCAALTALGRGPRSPGAARKPDTAPAVLSLPPPALAPEEWLRSQGVMPGMDAARVRALVHGGLAGQLNRVDPQALQVAVLLRAFVAKSLNTHVAGRTAHDLLDALARIMAGPADGRQRGLQELLHAIQGSPQAAKIDKVVGDLRRRHGTPETMLLAALGTARARQGALPTSEFLWLKSYQRTLWYALNNLGRRNAYHAEGVGPLAHLQAELAHGTGLSTPEVETAVAPLVRLAEGLGSGADGAGRAVAGEAA